MKFSGHSETKPVREAVGIVVRKTDDRGQVLQVRRPLDDPDLPNLWGLPAGKRQPGEKWLEAVKRAGREKLGVQLEVTALLGQGNMEREGYELFMRLYEASIKDRRRHRTSERREA